MVQVVETLEGEVFLLDLLDHLLWQLLELPERRHRLPPLQRQTQMILVGCLVKENTA